MMDNNSLKKYISEKNPFAIIRRKKMRRHLQNKTPSLICPNCIGGILFHDLGLQFQSPTVNTMILPRDFVKFVMNLDWYLEQELCFFKHISYDFPCAKLGDITIHFTHYQTEEDARKKWSERSKRINHENLFVFLTERDGISKEDILLLAKLDVRGLVVFTKNNYQDIPYTVQIRKYKNDREVGNILKRVIWNDGREYEQYFNFVKWFNEANGSDYNVQRYIKR